MKNVWWKVSAVCLFLAVIANWERPARKVRVQRTQGDGPSIRLVVTIEGPYSETVALEAVESASRQWFDLYPDFEEISRKVLRVDGRIKEVLIFLRSRRENRRPE
ncbi:MAG: hypothetical protein WCS85_04925 [Candidatus Peribacteraceae bacterium]|jgi:hypothetical protein